MEPVAPPKCTVANCRCFSDSSVTSNLYFALMAAFGTRLYGQNPSSARGTTPSAPTTTASTMNGTRNLRVVMKIPSNERWGERNGPGWPGKGGTPGATFDSSEAAPACQAGGGKNGDTFRF